jgi:hypothetical protein
MILIGKQCKSILIQMKKIQATLIILLFATLGLEAQIAYPTQPVAGYYENLKARVLAVIPTESELIGAKATVIPPGFKDTLLKYDWYEIASYFFYEKEYKSYFLDDLDNREKTYANNQFEFTRYTSSGIQYNMSLQRYKDASIKVEHTTFDESTAGKLVEVKKIGAKTVIVKEHYGEKEMIEIVSYKNGVMILNVKQTPNATLKRFHIAYLAVDKTF